MFLLILFAFIAGLVTILSPCILPVLPIVLSGSVAEGKKRPIGIVTGFITSFTIFTLTLSTIVKATGLPVDTLRNVAIVVIFFFGITQLSPAAQFFFEKLVAKISGLAPTGRQGNGFRAGVIVGLSLGLLWTPCVGPILASIISLALTGSVNGTAFLITFSYALGTAIPMLAITYGGRQLLTRVPWLLQNTKTIQRAFGILMIITALGMYTNLDRTFQIYVLKLFPNYGTGLTKFEDNETIKKELEKIQKQPMDETKKGEPMFVSLEDLGKAPEFIAGSQWFNTSPLILNQLRGKVVLVDFWTYTCINCIRTLPYVKSWHQKYKDKGFVVVGVHTPEFEFEKNATNVEKAIKDFAIEYPVMQDNNYDTWQAYTNHYWPAKYLVDKTGKIRYTHFGEGEYDKTEKKIQELLSENGPTVNEPIENPTYQVQAKTPETYLGYQRIEYLVSPETIGKDSFSEYSAPQQIPTNTFAYTGTWDVGAERAMPNRGSTLIFHFNAQKVFLVMNTKTETGEIKITIDGQPVAESILGRDVKNRLIKPDLTPDLRDDRVFESTISVSENRLYELLNLREPGDHTIKLEFFDDNLELYAFTFG